MSVFSAIAQWLQQHQLPCPVKRFLHIDCPGCGLQRSFTSMLQGDWQASWHYHPATVPMLLLLLLVMIHLKLKRPITARLIVVTYIFTSLVTVVFYVYKWQNGLIAV